ncbi:Methyltransferase type 11 domain-containing protein [Gammaproteobacteria bacterium]
MTAIRGDINPVRVAYRILERFRGTLFHPQWLADRFHRLSRRRLANIRGALVLDIGSGNSHHPDLDLATNSLLRLDYPPTNQYYACPPDVYADAAYLPVRAASVDVVLLLEVLEHVTDPGRVLGEVSQALRPGGRLYLSVPLLYPVHDAPHDYWRYTLHGLQALLARHGLRPLETVRHGHSLLAALQLLNLALLEAVRDLGRYSALLGGVAGVLVYGLCLAVNGLAAPLLLLRWESAGCLGYFVVAERP